MPTTEESSSRLILTGIKNTKRVVYVVVVVAVVIIADVFTILLELKLLSLL